VSYKAVFIYVGQRIIFEEIYFVLAGALLEHRGQEFKHNSQAGGSVHLPQESRLPDNRFLFHLLLYSVVDPDPDPDSTGFLDPDPRVQKFHTKIEES
jgi:hypothetical protein